MPGTLNLVLFNYVTPVPAERQGDPSLRESATFHKDKGELNYKTESQGWGRGWARDMGRGRGVW